MPTHVHQNIGSFWNAEMKLHVNRIVFMPVWNLIPVWVHLGSQVNVLYVLLKNASEFNICFSFKDEKIYEYIFMNMI